MKTRREIILSMPVLAAAPVFGADSGKSSSISMIGRRAADALSDAHGGSWQVSVDHDFVLIVRRKT